VRSERVILPSIGDEDSRHLAPIRYFHPAARKWDYTVPPGPQAPRVARV